MNMKKIIMVLMAIGLLILVGCGKETTPIGSKPFIGGTSSIEFSFVDGAPPAEVFDGGNYPFEVTLDLENKGEYDVPKEKIKIDLAGFYPLDFGNPGIQKNPDENLDKSYIDSEGNVIPGTKTYVTFGGFNFGGNLPANNNYKIRANLCYTYGTIAYADLCILDDLTKTENTVCKVTERKTSYSSSAPVQIESFEESIAGTDKITFSFKVVHTGSGTVSKKETSCSDTTINENKVWIEIDSGLTGLKCSGLSDGTDITGYTTLYGRDRMIRCTQATSDASIAGKDFEKKINIKAIYDYKDYEEVELKVKHTTG